MEYQCVYLSPEYKLGHDEGAEVLFETDNLALACTFIYEDWQKNQREIAVWQERSQGYRDYYIHKSRDEKGRFCKR